jgi:hypothetical protein
MVIPRKARFNVHNEASHLGTQESCITTLRLYSVPELEEGGQTWHSRTSSTLSYYICLGSSRILDGFSRLQRFLQAVGKSDTSLVNAYYEIRPQELCDCRRQRTRGLVRHSQIWVLPGDADE